MDDSDKYVAWVGSDFKVEGLACGEWLKAYAADKGIGEINALVIEGSVGASATIGRTDGFKEIADREGWTLLDSQSGDFTEAGGQEVMESFCQSYKGQFNVVICQNDNEAAGAMTAMDQAGITYGVGGDVILVSFDANKPYVQMVCDGKINANFECNPMAAPTVSEIIQALEKGESMVRIQLNPENLGSVTVEITRSAAGLIRVALSAHSGETRGLLERHAGELQGMIANRTQQDVEVNVQHSQEGQQGQNQQNPYDGRSGSGQGGQEERRQPRREQSGDSRDFMQQLRLGLIPGDE